jgi:thioredoxin 2
LALGTELRTAKCQACTAALFQGVPLQVDDEILQRHLTLASQGVLVVVWAPWCGACQFAESELTEAATRLEPDVRLLKLNTNESEIAGRFGLGGIPALLLFRSGREIGRTLGPQTADQIVSWTLERLGILQKPPHDAKSAAAQPC